VNVKCARCGAEYENPHVTSQMDADGKLAVCDPCDDDVMREIAEEANAEGGR
jgi:DNA-directed RNA polymerase subunit RPC12/RpoP